MSVETRVDTLLRVVADCDEDRIPASDAQPTPGTGPVVEPIG